MKVILKYIIVQCLLFTSLAVSAHSPDVSSTLLVEESPDEWVLQIRAALTAFEYEVETHFGKDAYTTPKEFQNLVIEHVLKNMDIKTNDGNLIELKNGHVKLGHETSITFEVTGIPSALESVHVSNTSFKDIPRNQSALIILKKGFEKNQFKLDKHNNNRIDLTVENSKFIAKTTAVAEASFPTSILMGAILAFAILFLAFKVFSSKKQQKLETAKTTSKV